MTPFSLLCEIDQKSRRHAAPLPQQVEQVAQWRGIGFMLNGQVYVAPMADVAEIIQLPHMTRVPGVKSWVLGVANIRGRLVSIMDLASLMELPSRNQWRSQRVLVIEHHDFLMGLVVDAVLGMQTFRVDSQVAAPSTHEHLDEFVDIAFEKNRKVWPVFQCRELIESPQFLNIAV